MQAALSGLAKSIIISCHLHTFCKPYVCRCILQLYFCSSWCWTISVLSVIVEFNRKRKSLLWFSFLFLGGGGRGGGGCKAWTKGTNRKIIFKSIVQWLILSLFKCKFCLLLFYFCSKGYVPPWKNWKKERVHSWTHIQTNVWINILSSMTDTFVMFQWTFT